MSKRQYIILGVLILVLGIVVGSISFSKNKNINGSVAQGNEYHATSTKAGVTGGTMTLPATLCSTGGSLGSVVITGAGTGIVNIYDGTSTVTNSQYGTTTLASFPASTAAGTYTFDLATYRGIAIDATGNVATATITYRCN